MAKPKQVDWEAISREYRAGIRSLRNIGDEYGVTEGAIRKRAKAEEWPRDLSEKIEARAKDLVRKEEVRNGTIGTKETDVIEANATMQAEKIISHRKDITRFRVLVAKLITELESQTENLPLFEELGELMRAPDDKGMDKLNDVYQKVISTGSRSTTVKTLADTLKTLIALEREAFGLEKGINKNQSLGEFLESLQ